MPDTDPLTAQFLAWCEAEHVPPNTIARRRSVLTSIGNAGTATKEEVEAWWDSRRDQAPATRANDLACLRALYKWLSRWDLRDDDPTRRLEAPKVNGDLPNPFKRDDLRRILAAVDDRPDLRRAVALGAYAGLRVSEAAALHWSNVDLEAHRIRIVRSKGGKSRLVGLSPLLLDEIAPQTDGNVVTGGAPYSADALQRKVNRAIQAAGVDGTFHQLRARFATVTVAETGNLLAVSEALGHSSLDTIRRYARVSDEMLDVIAAAAAR